MSAGAARLEVAARYLGREQVLIEMPNGTLVADHPRRLGGDGRGPSAAELLLMALSSAAVLAADAAGSEMYSSLGFRSSRERVDGPMLSVTRMARIDHALAAPALNATALAAAMSNPVAQALTSGIEIHEVTEVVASGPTGAAGSVNEVLLADDRAWQEKDLGFATVSEPESEWRITSTPVASAAALARHGHQAYVVAAAAVPGAPLGPTPNELLTASLAACTVYFIAHHCGFRSIPVDSITARATATIDDSGVVTAIERHARVQGSFDAASAADTEYIANHCYIGLTLRAGVAIDHQTTVGPATPGPAIPDPECDDGACCVPDLADRAATTAAVDSGAG